MQTDVNNRKFPRVVIVGGGFGGIEVAKKLKDKAVEVLLLDRNNYHTFQPLLYQVATGTLEADSIAFPLRKMFKGQKNFKFRIADVQTINAKTKILSTSIGDIPYDYLVLATGATTNFFGNALTAHYALGMKNVPEALNIRSYCLQNIEQALLAKTAEERHAHLNFVVVGAGPTGVELSGAIAELRNHILAKDYPELDTREMQVFLVEGLDKVLANLSPQASEKAALYLNELKVQIRLKTQVTGYDGNVITFADGTSIASKTVIWSAGVKGQFPEGIDPAVIVKGNRIQTDEVNRVKGMNDVFAIGDVAAVITEDTPRGHPGVAPVAQQQGRTLAANILRLMNGEPTQAFTYFDKGSMATIGRNKAVVDIGKIRFQGFFAWWVWMFVHLMSLIGFRNRLVTFINWILSYLTFNGGIRLIIRPFERAPLDEASDVIEPGKKNPTEVTTAQLK